MRCVLIRAVVCVGLLCVLSPVAMARTEFLTVLDGKRLKGSSICFSRSGDEQDYFKWFLGDGRDPVCLPADDVLDTPVGAWHYYATNPSGFVSAHPNQFTAFAVSDSYRTQDVTMREAGTLNLEPVVSRLSPRQFVAVYFSNDTLEFSPSLLRILPAGQISMDVPAGVPVVPMVLEGVRPVLVGDPIVVPPHETRMIPPIESRSTLLVPVRLLLSDDLWRSREIDDLVVSIESHDGSPLSPLLPLRPKTQVQRSLLIVRPRTPGLVRFRVKGNLWKAEEVELEARPNQVVVADDWLTGTPAGALTLTWQMDNDAASIRQINPACPDEKVEDGVLRVSRCEESGEPPKCTLIATEKLTGTEGETIVPSLDPGSYAAEIAFPPIPVSRRTFAVTAARNTTVSHTIATDIIRGTVTYGGVPSDAAIVQAGRSKTSTQPGTGEYVIPVSKRLGRVPVAVTYCDRSVSFVAVPKEPIPAGGRFDIAIPDNQLILTVVEAESRKPIAASIVYSAVDPSYPENAFYSGGGRTDNGGSLTVRHLTTDYPIVACAEASGYRQACTKPLAIPSSGKTSEQLTMQPYARSGRLKSDTRMRGVTIYWVSRSGLLRERMVPSDVEGTFWYDYEPVEGDYLVIASQSHPLVAYRPASFADITVPIPSAVPTMLSIVLRDSYPRDRATPTLVLNGMLVPAEAFANHCQWRGLGDVVKGKPYVVPGVFVNGPVVVLLAPVFGARPADLGPEDDIFALPQHRGVIDRKMVGPDGVAVFE